MSAGFKLSPRNRAQVASYHEAGHAVIARGLGVPVVSIEANSDGGLTHFPDAYADPGHQTMVAMAGPIAESVFRGCPVRTAYTDAETVRRMMAVILSPSQRTFSRYTRRAVIANWPTIKAVAGELLRIGRISGKRLDKIIAEVRA